MVFKKRVNHVKGISSTSCNKLNKFKSEPAALLELLISNKSEMLSKILISDRKFQWALRNEYATFLLAVRKYLNTE